jgi:predicted ATPase
MLHNAVVTEDVPSTEGVPTASRLVELQPDSHGRVLRLDSPIVGRRRQLASLGAAFEDAVADRSLRLFTVLGDAGVGKSRLAREFAAGAADVARVLHGRCPPYGAAPFDPVLDALGETSTSRETDVDPTHLRASLERLALEQPLVLVLDDLHWAEQALLDLLDDLVATSRDVPILLLCLARPELVEARPGWGGGKPNVSAVLLEPLNEAESERLVDNLLGESDLPDVLRDHVIRTAEGNPLFVEELLATLVDRNVLTRQSGRWTTTATAAVPVPGTIQALIASRIDLLPRDERATLELASIGGERVFARDDVAALAEGLDVDACLSSLVRKELVRPVPGDPTRFSFRHDLVREAAYASLPMRARAELHDRLADRFHAEPGSTVLAGNHRERAKGYRQRLAGLAETD